MGFNCWNDWLLSMFQVSTSHNITAAMLDWYAFVICHIWKAGCKNVFDGVTMNVNQISLTITNDYSDRYRISSSHITERVSGITTIGQWTCPQSSFVKLNFDASFKEETKDVGIGLILGNCAGVRDGGRCCCIKATDPEQAEAEALLEAIIWARRKGIRKPHLEGDRENVIRSLNGSLSSIK
ncbi:hypothetical protein C5167_047021, partial [Papaver somniferum]